MESLDYSAPVAREIKKCNKSHTQPGMVVSTLKPSTQEADAGGSLSRGQPGTLYKETAQKK